MYKDKVISTCLVIHVDYEENATTISNHYKSFENFGSAYYRRVTLDRFISLEEKYITLFDCIILHYSIYYPMLLRKEYHNCVYKLMQYKGLKIAFIQDDYRLINKMNDIFVLLGINSIYSILLKEVQKEVYKKSINNGIDTKETLTGYIDEVNYRPSFNPEEKVIDVSYRARDLKDGFGWLGKKALEKAKIATIKDQLDKNGFKTDISLLEEDRLYGNEWNKLLTKSKATLISISGSSVCDFTGEIQTKYDELYMKGIRGKELEDVYSKFDGQIEATVISPRVFEATLNNVLLIGYEDHYSNILEAGKHYVVLKRDHSNFKEIAEILRDEKLRNKYIDKAYEDLILSKKYSWKTFVNDFENEQNIVAPKNNIKLEILKYMNDNIPIPIPEITLLSNEEVSYKKKLKSIIAKYIYPFLPKIFQKIIMRIYKKRHNFFIQFYR